MLRFLLLRVELAFLASLLELFSFGVIGAAGDDGAAGVPGDLLDLSPGLLTHWAAVYIISTDENGQAVSHGRITSGPFTERVPPGGI